MVSAVKTLLLTGYNNHDWKRSAYFCRDLLNATGVFDVTLTENPTASLEDAAALAGYQLIFVDYNGPAWSAKAQTNYLQAVRAGAGLVILHAADNMHGWPEFEKQCGLVFCNKAGHGNYHEFKVTIADSTHPITAGLEDFVLWDELYHKMENPQGVQFHALATAFSDPAQKGTGNHEPVAGVLQYGAGRVFHLILGHVWQQGIYPNYMGEKMLTFENKGFQRLLLRGCEWAATGKVTIQ